MPGAPWRQQRKDSKTDEILTLYWSLASEKMGIANLGHPSRSRKMTVVHCLCPVRFGGDVDAENMGGGLAPVCAFIVSVQQTQIIYEMGFIVGGELRYVRRAIRELAGAHGAPVMSPVNQPSPNTGAGYAQVLHRSMQELQRQPDSVS